MSQAFSPERFQQMPLIGIMRNIPARYAREVINCYAGTGLTTLEITMNSAGATETIAWAVQTYGHTLNIGAGTVCTPQELEQALTAGAQFVVTPIIKEEVIKTCVAANIPIFPGAFTPTEIYRAWELGASMVKVFPATKLGPEFIKDVLAPLNQIKLVPTGGISLTNFIDYFKAGAQGVGIGSTIFPPELIKNEQWPELSNIFREYVQKYTQFKGSILE